MATITFDTLKFTRRLRDAGISEPQAEAIAQAFREAQGEAELATKADMHDLDIRSTSEIKLLRAEMRDMETRLTSEMKLLRWMMGATFGGVFFILIRLLLPFSHGFSP